MGSMLTRPAAGTIPDAPGSYQFKDRDGRVIYVGKAKSLRSRLSNYFVNPALLPPRTRQMVTAAESVEWIEVRNEVEALFLEFNLIKKHKPRLLAGGSGLARPTGMAAPERKVRPASARCGLAPSYWHLGQTARQARLIPLDRATRRCSARSSWPGSRPAPPRSCG